MISVGAGGLKTLTTSYVIGVAVNYPWELAQASLFTADSHRGSIFVHCFYSSLGDGLLILLLFVLGWVAQGHKDWFRHPSPRGYLVLLVSGTAVALTVEWIAVHVLERWTYADAMPQVPLLEVGLVPVLQMLLLPPLIVFAAARFSSQA